MRMRLPQKHIILKFHWEQRRNASITRKNFRYLNSKYLKPEVNRAKPSKLKENNSLSRILYHHYIKWEGRIKTFSDTQDLKKFILHRPFSRKLLQNMLHHMKGGKQERIHGPHETEDPTTRGAEGIYLIWRRWTPEQLLCTRHREDLVRKPEATDCGACIHSHPSLQSDCMGTGKAHAWTLKRK